MNIYGKLQLSRSKFLQTDIKKSGKNKFAGYEYFELGDFIPAINTIFTEIGLCGVVRFTPEVASLTVYDVESDSAIEFTSPMVFANNPKGQAIQDLGSTHTYLRRYLWLMAMEIVEHDAVDAAAPIDAPRKAEPKEMPRKEEPKQEIKADPKPAGASDDQKLFVDKLIEWAAVQTNPKELISAWQANQKQIDELKVSDPELFKHLKTCFSELKAKVTTKE
jgi:hypothetical protein